MNSHPTDVVPKISLHHNPVLFMVLAMVEPALFSAGTDTIDCTHAVYTPHKAAAVAIR
jgi:hypothetical protein